MLRTLTPAILILMSFAVLFFTVTGNHGLLHLQQLNNELQQTKENNRNLESDIAKLNNEIYVIEHSRARLEKIAREELGLSKANEIIYVVPEAEKLPPQTTTAKSSG